MASRHTVGTGRPRTLSCAGPHPATTTAVMVFISVFPPDTIFRRQYGVTRERGSGGCSAPFPSRFTVYHVTKDVSAVPACPTQLCVVVPAGAQTPRNPPLQACCSWQPRERVRVTLLTSLTLDQTATNDRCDLCGLRVFAFQAIEQIASLTGVC